MPETTITRREFDQDTAAAGEAATSGPVLITEGDEPSLVLLSYDDFLRLKRVQPSIADLLAMPEAEEIEFDPPKLDLKLKIPDFS